MTHPERADAITGATTGVGIEVADGGMRLAATLTTAAGVIQRRQLSAPPSPEEALTAINALIGQALERGASGSVETAVAERSSALGIAVWGDVDPIHGVTLGMPHAPGWDGFPLVERLADHWRAPVYLQTAAAAAGLAEATSGAGQPYRVVLYAHSGRTLASALIANGAIVSGATGRAGKLAHWLVQPDGPRCACGARGHLDPLASAQSIVRTTIGLASGSDASTAAMLRVSGGRAEAMTLRQVTQLAREGDPAAQAALATAWDALAVALANLVAALDPDAIVIGGAPADAGEAFCGPLRERLAALCGSWRPTPEVLPGRLEPRAALTGARLLARQ